MLNKKVIIGIVVFIAAGLLAFTFANPLNKDEKSTDENTKEIEKNDSTNKEEPVVSEPVTPENPVTTNPVTTRTTPVVRTTNENVTNERDNLLKKLADLLASLNYKEVDYTKDSFNPYKDLLGDAKDVTDLTNDEINELIENIKEAETNLVELKLIDLTISNLENVYKRLEGQEDLTFTAIYNDSTRNKIVEVKTTDKFDTTKVINNLKMTYSYSDKFGSDTVVYTYSVIANDKDNALADLKELLDSLNYDEEDYTTDSYEPFKELLDDAKKAEQLTTEDIKDLINDIKEAENNLVELKLINLTINSYFKEYKRLDNQEDLLFTAIYNDASRNKKVSAVANEEFNSNIVISGATIVYTYSDDYGTSTATYTYNVIANDRDNALKELKDLLDDLKYDEDDYTTDSFKPYKELLEDAKDVTELTTEEIKDLIDGINEAIANLVELELTNLTISANNTEYKRLESQEKLTFTAIYNDDLRNKVVTAATKDTFDSSKVASKSMTYSYSDKYGKASVAYKYNVKANDKDNALNELKQLIDGLSYKEEDYTTDSYKPYKELVADALEADQLTTEQIKELIVDINEAITNLVELELTDLTISANNTEYKRLESQEKLTFTAIYNDDLRNKVVTATTKDTFDSSKVASKSMTYSYSDKYGKASVAYKYNVKANDKDNALNELKQLIDGLNYKEEDYTTDSYKPYKELLEEAKDTDKLTVQEIKELIVDINEAIDNLVELELTDLTISANNTEYKRLESQEKLTFTAIYNDTLRNKIVSVTTNDSFDSSKVASKSMTYSYSDKYGNDTVVYNYNVVYNNTDLAISSLKATLSNNVFERTNKKTNISGLTVKTVNNIKEEIVIGANKYTVTGFDTTTLGEKEITIKLKNTDITTKLNYTVIKNSNDKKVKSITATLEKTSYVINEDMSNLTVSVTDNYGDTYEVNNYNIIKAFDSTTSGNKTLEVKYENLTVKVDYKVSEQYLFEVSVLTNNKIQVIERYIDLIHINTIKVDFINSNNGRYQNRTETITYKNYDDYFFHIGNYFEMKEWDNVMTHPVFGSVYVNPKYQTESFGGHLNPTKIVISYTRSNGINTQEHTITYSVSNGVVIFASAN